MCRPTRCRSCGKTTWAGCGQHIAQVKARVPADQWCNGPSSHSGEQGQRSGWLSRIFSR